MRARQSLGPFLSAFILVFQLACSGEVTLDGNAVAEPGSCGDGQLDDGEVCDDGNQTAGDGCSAQCEVEDGFSCTPDNGCIGEGACGDGVLAAGETCDDGNQTAGDGCSADCAEIEAGFDCAEVGSPCDPVPVCGNGRVEGDEACDDGDQTAADGCSATCEVEAGFGCFEAGEPCVVLGVCGNGRLEDNEACDDGNTRDDDGCAADCLTVDDGTVCPVPGVSCVPADVCGNGVVEGSEGCDDGNAVAGDGCGATCTEESGFSCPAQGGPCIESDVCGNGVIEAGEACDDGNATAGDGCAADCSNVEPGFVCPGAGAGCVTAGVCGNGVVESGEVCDDGNTFDLDGCARDCDALEDGYVCPETGGPCVRDGVCGNGVVDSDEACDDGNTVAGDGCSALCDTIEEGWRCELAAAACTRTCGDGVADPGERCDDGNRTSGDGCAALCDAVEPGFDCPSGGACVPRCGNGTVDSGEDCDTAGASATCDVDCTFAACGDGTLNLAAGESCDDGGESASCDADCTPASCGDSVVNLTAGETCDDGGNSASCDADCTAVSCGDGFTNDAAGEACDDAGESTVCDADCTVAECGDFVVNTLAGETCDDGPTGSPTCSATCVNRSCGNGVVEPGEDCDDGSESASCDANCTAVACGDGTVNVTAGESCDDGGESTTCDSDCTAVSCGDLLVNGAAGEECDDGGESARCNADCTEAECGDSVINATAGETCDDGVNDGSYGRCTASCQEPTQFCGNGSVEAAGGEQCDDGTNDGSYNTCASNCQLPSSYCGDGVTDTTNGEECDDGINSGAYGTCAFETADGFCQEAPRCGDGILDPLNETCDDGDALNTGAYGGCRDSCRLAPFCGDGRVEPGVEFCDDGGVCDDGTTACASDAVCQGIDPTWTCTPVAGDGCAADCQTVETGFFCPEEGAPCLAACGNGRFDAGESCDDGGRCADDSFCVVGTSTCGDGSTCQAVAGDGCSTSCTVEAGFGCGRFGELCEPLCGNGVLDAGEFCDDGGRCDDGSPCSSNVQCEALDPTWSCVPASGDGCAADCGEIEAGFECPVVGAVCNVLCGNARLDGAEECDLGSLNADDQYGGCNTDCTLGPRCGDGVVDAGDEQCDFGDGSNEGAYGGCRADCTLSLRCGDGLVLAPETCDDGGLCDDGTTPCSDNLTCQALDPTWSCTGVAGDGCDASCQVEGGFVCRTPGGACEDLGLCGNGVIDGTERCDDGGVCNDGTPCTDDAFCQLANPGWTCEPAASDGCDATCSTVEEGWFCPNPGDACTALACGDGVVAGIETCDDGNTLDGDGCDASCQVEPGSCGNGILERDEQCDDFNTNGGDGCDPSCQREAGFVCYAVPGELCGSGSGAGQCPCANVGGQTCGNGVWEGTEACDDGPTCGDVERTACGADAQCEALLNTCESRCGNGVCELGECSTCTLDCGPSCTGSCGDGTCDGGETASDCPSDCGSRHCGDRDFTTCSDDADCAGLAYPCVNRAGDGCGPDCLEEPLFECFIEGDARRCRPICGDGQTLVDLGEECDDGNTVSGDGCSAACAIEPGFACTDFASTPASLDVQFTIRDVRFFDRCVTRVGTVCGDDPSEEGYPVSNGGECCGHPDFDRWGCNPETTGVVESDLGADGKPVLILPPTGCLGDPSDPIYSGEPWFSYWYNTTAGINRAYDATLTLNQDTAADPTGRTYVFDSFDFSEPVNGAGRPDGGFFPLDHCAGNGIICSEDADCVGQGEVCVHEGFGDLDLARDNSVARARNFSFTSEWRTFFQYRGGESLTFRGDDDVWIFINGRLAVDLGGLHSPVEGDVTLSNAVDPTLEMKYDSRFDIYEGGVYEIAFFHAERRRDQSNFALTLAGFIRSGESSCTGVCGDGIAIGSEDCDGGTEGLACGDLGFTGGVLSCDPDCTWNTDACTAPAQCGDGGLDPGEQCDDGDADNGDACTNACRDAACGDGFTRMDITDPGDPAYEACDDGNADNTDACTDSCALPACGDGFLQTGAGEFCDDGANNGDYGSCALGCQTLGPRCGDGIINGPEVCDDGINDGTYGTCAPGCLNVANFCGDAIVSAQFEECDAGTAANDGSPPERCAADCTSTASCGDGVVDTQLGEACDDGGANDDVAYEGCTTACQLGPRCGDGLINGAEVCDNGVNAGNYGGCLPGCVGLASFCGDGVPDAGVEECDDGVNSGAYGACNPDCTLAASCGDGIVDAGREECDLGGASNTGAYGTCNSDCTNPPFCGDGIVNGPEVCDDGINDGSYGSCSTTCEAVPRCGDGVIDAAFGEECDDGDEDNDGRYGGCRSNCRLALFCGDGRVSTLSGGEECDGDALGGRSCTDLDGDGVTEPGDFSGGTLFCIAPPAAEQCQLDTSGCFACGDGVINGTEVCEGVGPCSDSDVECGGATCASLGFSEGTGGLACLGTCQFDTSGCDTGSCGNGVLDPGEECDGQAFGTRSCTDLDGNGVPDEDVYTGGTLRCTSSCTVDASTCEFCGDGIVNGDEVCDGSETGGQTCTSRGFEGGTLGCAADCTAFDESGCAACGDCSDCAGDQACIEGACGECITSADCCAPRVCFSGSCVLF